MRSAGGSWILSLLVVSYHDFTGLNMETASVDRLLALYRESAEGTSAPDPKAANRCQREMHAVYKKLRVTPEGRAGITALMNDSSPHVRCWAAAHSLGWNVTDAISTLRALRENGGPCSFDAEMTLEAFNDGRLSFEY
jgi:hypothetical protein